MLCCVPRMKASLVHVTCSSKVTGTMAMEAQPTEMQNAIEEQYAMMFTDQSMTAYKVTLFMCRLQKHCSFEVMHDATKFEMNEICQGPSLEPRYIACSCSYRWH